MAQIMFNPLNYGFEWVGDWYKFDSHAAHKAALKARNAKMKELRAQGISARGFSLSNQLVTRGGIGSGHPQIDLIVTAYGINFENTEPRIVHAETAYGATQSLSFGIKVY